MNKTIKKLISLTLGLTLILAIVTGCTNSRVYDRDRSMECVDHKSEGYEKSRHYDDYHKSDK